MESFVTFLEGALAISYFIFGGSKLLWSREGLAPIVPYAEDFSDSGFRSLGAIELVGSLGLLFPIFIGGFEFLAPVSAAVLIVVQSRLGVLHWRRTGNGAYVTFTVLVVVGLLIVIWGRLGPYPL